MIKNQRFFGRRTTNAQKSADRQRAHQAAALRRKEREQRAEEREGVIDSFDVWCAEQQRRFGTRLTASVRRIMDERDARSMHDEEFESRR